MSKAQELLNQMPEAIDANTITRVFNKTISDMEAGADAVEGLAKKLDPQLGKKAVQINKDYAKALTDLEAELRGKIK